jgi:hypothetical protein
MGMEKKRWMEQLESNNCIKCGGPVYGDDPEHTGLKCGSC